MKIDKSKVKGIGVTAFSGLLAVGTTAAPVNVLAEELIKTGEETDYGFGYKKKTVEGKTRGDSVYALRLKKGLTNLGEEFKPDEKQVKEASKVFKAGSDAEQRVNLEYDGLYDFVNLQREPGYYPQLKESMNAKDGLFEFPNSGGHNMKQILVKEEEFVKNLEVILRNTENLGLKGKFKITKIMNPKEVYGKHFEDIFFDEAEAAKEGYLKPENKEQANTVKSWEDVNEDFAELVIGKDSKVEWKIDGPKDEEAKYAERLGKDLEEGIYEISQLEAESGYIKREKIMFKATIDSEGNPIVDFGIEKPKDFKALHDLEYFKYGSHDGDDKGLSSLYQTLLVNNVFSGLTPEKPEDPNNPERKDPEKPAYENGFNKEGYRYEEKILDENDEKIYDLDALDKSDHVKVNVGESFGLSFDIRVSEGFSGKTASKSFAFYDLFDDAIMFGDSYKKDGELVKDFMDRNFDEIPVKIFLGDEEIPFEEIGDIVKWILLNDEEGKKGIEVLFRDAGSTELAEKISGETITIKMDDLYLEKGTRKDVKNRAYIIHGGGNLDWKKPEDKDVIDPEKPGYSIDPEKPGDPNDPDNRPYIPTTPEITIDPITVDFRMGVVDQGTTVLENAKYEIKEFVPSRGKGGINEKGNLYIGKIEYDINKIIEDSVDGFVKLKDLPAGKYRMVETAAPSKGDDKYRLVTNELVFHVNENEELVTIEAPIVKNGGEVLTDKKINAKELYREGDTPNRNDANFNSEKVLGKEAMLHHYKYINTPETGTLAQVPFFLGGGVAVSAGVHLAKKKKED